MPNSTADAAKSAAAGTPGAEAKPRARRGRRKSADAAAPMNGITITRWNLTLAIAVLGGAFTLVWNRTAALDSRVWDLRDQVAGLRADIGDLRAEVRNRHRRASR